LKENSSKKGGAKGRGTTQKKGRATKGEKEARNESNMRGLKGV